jgi:putative tryptophan/tyrosine transport system substrate-binding protein
MLANPLSWCPGLGHWMHFDQLGRRKFITLLGGAAAAWPLAMRAQQPSVPVIGRLGGISPGANPDSEVAFRQGLSETGFVEGRNVVVEYRWTEGQFDRVAAQAAELIRLQVTVIVASGGSPALAKSATTTIPIVFITGDLDPVRSGLVAGLNQPGGNATGVMLFTSALGAKRLELLHEVVPQAATVAVLTNPAFPDSEIQLKDLREAALALGLQLHLMKASSEREFDAAFAGLGQQRVGALLVGNDPFFNARRDQIVGLAARYGLPAICSAGFHPSRGPVWVNSTHYRTAAPESGLPQSPDISGSGSHPPAR